MHLIRDVHDRNFQHLKVDSRLCKNIIEYDHQFVRKNQEHVDFFGSALLGTHKVIWGTEDQNRWIDDILQVDEIALQKDIHDLPESVNPKHPKTKKTLRKVAMNYINQSIVYLAYRVQNEKTLSNSMKTQTVESLFRILLYKFITSLIGKYFKLYQADRRTSEAAYNELNDRFDVKRHGSWKALIDDRVETLASSKTIHRRAIETMEGDKEVIYLISDIQTRIRRLILAYFSKLDEVTKNKRHLVSTSSMMDTDEGYAIKDIIIEQKTYYRYLTSVLVDKRSLIKDDILMPLLDINTSAQPDKVMDVLTHISKNGRSKEITDLCRSLLVYAFTFMKEKQIKTSELNLLAIKLKAMFTGSKIKTPEILQLREQGDKLVRKGTKYSRTAPVSTERTVVLLYLVIRALAKNHYK